MESHVQEEYPATLVQVQPNGAFNFGRSVDLNPPEGALAFGGKIWEFPTPFESFRVKVCHERQGIEVTVTAYFPAFRQAMKITVQETRIGGVLSGVERSIDQAMRGLVNAVKTRLDQPAAHHYRSIINRLRNGDISITIDSPHFVVNRQSSSIEGRVNPNRQEVVIAGNTFHDDPDFNTEIGVQELIKVLRNMFSFVTRAPLEHKGSHVITRDPVVDWATIEDKEKLPADAATVLRERYIKFTSGSTEADKEMAEEIEYIAELCGVDLQVSVLFQRSNPENQ